MKIYIAKHYWKEGENATWECHEKVDKALFEYLKENYHNFTKSKPANIKEGNHFVYLCYEDGKDIYGRDITNVTFFISKKNIPMDYCHSVYSNLELSVTQKSKLSPIHVGLLVLGLIMAYFIFFGDKTDDINSLTDTHKEEVQQKVENVHPEKKVIIIKEKPVVDQKKKEKDEFNNKLSKKIKNIADKLKNANGADLKLLRKDIKNLYSKKDDTLTSKDNIKRLEELNKLFKKRRNNAK